MMEALNLNGRVALVTGAGRGIGRAIAHALAEAGADVALTSRTQAQLDAVAEEVIDAHGVKAIGIAGDQAQTDQVQDVVDRAETELGPIDILVNNAGQPVDAPLLEMSEEAARDLIDVNLMGPIRYLKSVGPGMIARGYGKVINIASMDAIIGTPNLSVYCATKGGLGQLTKALAAEWARYGVYVNAVCPGYIKTAANEHILADERLRQAVTRRIPLRRVGMPEDIGVVTVFLASSASDFVTGALYTVDGGETAV